MTVACDMISKGKKKKTDEGSIRCILDSISFYKLPAI